MTGWGGGSGPVPAVPAARIRLFEPDSAWFLRGPGGIHGLEHETRVLIWTQVLAAMLASEGARVDADALGWAAAMHDTQRLDDGIDHGHGARAANWLTLNDCLLPPGVSVEQVEYLCRWHVPHDHLAPEMTAELSVFKDADALDRWRIGGPDPEFLRTDAARRLLDPSYRLWRETSTPQSATNHFERIVKTAVQLGILSDD